MTELVNYTDTFAAFQAASSALRGGDQKPLVRFSKGDWLFGPDKLELSKGTSYAVNMPEAEWGWMRWHDKEPVERRMGLINSGFVPASRDTLGHTDKSLWPVDDKGNPQDPWQKTIEIPARALDGERSEVVLVGSSMGWEGACKKLFGEYGKGLKEGRGGRTPIVRIETSHYDHKKYGRTKVPVLELVEWRDPAKLVETTKKTKF